MTRTSDLMTVVVADDHPLVLRALTDLIGGDPELDLLDSCGDGLLVLERIFSLQPDLAIVDVGMPNRSGLEILKEVKSARLLTRVVLLTASIRDPDILNAVESGVDGLLLKSAAPETLLRCLRNVADGQQWLGSEVSDALERETARREKGRQLLGSLTEREREIAALAIQNLSNKEIARGLDIAEGTVKIHLNNIYTKLSVSSRASLSQTVGNYLDQL